MDTLKNVLAGSSNANDHEIIAVDLSSLASVHTATNDLNQRVASGSIPRILAVVLNAALQRTYFGSSYPLFGFNPEPRENVLGGLTL